MVYNLWNYWDGFISGHIGSDPEYETLIFLVYFFYIFFIWRYSNPFGYSPEARLPSTVTGIPLATSNLTPHSSGAHQQHQPLGSSASKTANDVNIAQHAAMPSYSIPGSNAADRAQAVFKVNAYFCQIYRRVISENIFVCDAESSAARVRRIKITEENHWTALRGLKCMIRFFLNNHATLYIVFCPIYTYKIYN